MRLDIIRADTVDRIKAATRETLQARYNDLLPGDLDTRVLIKPNLNSYMNALTGNTTDLRLMAAVIELLKDAGYSDITIAEGTNSGFYRNNISVIKRLAVDKLAGYYGVNVKDLNYSEPVEVGFEGGVKAGVARECMEAGLFINMPKLKTHFEAGMSVCLKNLMGCLVGQVNKKKTHQSLWANIVNLNAAIRPHLHIVDGIVAMEGLGPTRGTPIKTSAVLLGTDPFVTDLVCSRLAGLDHNNVGPLRVAIQRELLDKQRLEFAMGFPLERVFGFKPPKAGLLASFIHNPKRQRHFIAIRNTAVFRYLASTQLGGTLLYKSGLRQDVFIQEEMQCRGLTLDPSTCNNCGRCADYCPIDLPLPQALSAQDPRCIRCLYCYCVCPTGAIAFEGTLGFMAEQNAQYETIIKGIA
ncbi:MAG: DUF362 domain-containing protein [Nitrospirae bacterium]|nr:DUF362 domain-containing protein [Nitrospirota bacterium]